MYIVSLSLSPYIYICIDRYRHVLCVGEDAHLREKTAASISIIMNI